MKLQRSTWTLLGIAVILGGYVLATELSRSQSDSSTLATAGDQDLFRFEEDDVQSFTVVTEEQTLAFEKDDEGVWQMTSPVAKRANDATVAFLLSQLATGRASSPTETTAEQLAEYGLAEPFAKIDVKLANDDSHTLWLGDVNFSGESRYAIADPDPALTTTADTEPAANTEATVILVPNVFASAVERPLEEWQNLEVVPEIEPPAGDSPEDETSVDPDVVPDTETTEAN
ncbi:MAG: DUF4340 domain-containing protein [Thainema sp.]